MINNYLILRNEEDEGVRDSIKQKMDNEAKSIVYFMDCYRNDKYAEYDVAIRIPIEVSNPAFYSNNMVDINEKDINIIEINKTRKI